MTTELVVTIRIHNSARNFINAGLSHHLLFLPAVPHMGAPLEAPKRGVEPFFPSLHTTGQRIRGVLRIEGILLHPGGARTLSWDGGSLEVLDESKLNQAVRDAFYSLVMPSANGLDGKDTAFQSWDSPELLRL
jgi:hypothetical protein